MLLQIPGFTINGLQNEPDHWHIHLTSILKCSQCPTCHQNSSRVHSYYHRTVTDLPIAEKPVLLELSVRRFRCHTPTCPQRIFCERLTDPIVHARRTKRQVNTLASMAVELGGRAAARLGSRLKLLGGRTTVLNALKAMPLPIVNKPRIIGVDDFFLALHQHLTGLGRAFKRGHTYGTVIVDLETHKPIDLLPDRQASTLITWLKAHPSVKIVTRDRAKEYAQAISQGAPRAKQIVDRWHLLKNLREMLQRVVNANRSVVTQIVNQARQSIKLPRSGSETVARNAARAHRQSQYERIQKVFAEIGTINGTAKKLGVSRWLVRESIKNRTPAHRQFNKRIPSILDPFEKHLFVRWMDGCRSAKTLWLELQNQGFLGSLKSVERWARRQRLAAEVAPDQLPVKRPGQGFNVRMLSWLLIQENTELNEEERALVGQIEQGCSAVVTARGLALRFAEELKQQNPKPLQAWLVEAVESGIPVLREFAVGLKRELSAIKAAFSSVWSNGPVEGMVNKIKLVKRQMFGRASFALLRRRVLLGA
jgi:transposase